MFQLISPLSLWNLIASPDEQYLSQPTCYWDDGHVVRFLGDGACAARCEVQMWLSEGDGSHKTADIQCGQLAMLAPDGSQHLCVYHFHSIWCCRNCGELLAAAHAETAWYCSTDCQVAYEAIIAEWQKDPPQGDAHAY